MSSADKKTPRFSVIRVLAVGLLIHQFLSISIVGFSVARFYPLAVIEDRPEEFRAIIEKVPDMTPEEREVAFDKLFEPRMPEGMESPTFIMLILSVCLIYILYYHFPLYKYFHILRKEVDPPEDLRKLCKRRIIGSALVAGVLPSAAVVLSLLITWIVLLLGLFEDPAFTRVFVYILPMNMVSIVLSGLLVYKWQKYRAQTYFAVHIFNERELRVKPPGSRDMPIRRRLWLASAMTTILPLALVTLYVFTSVSYLPDADKISEPELVVLMGDYLRVVETAGLRPMFVKWVREDILANVPGLLFVNAINTPILLVGIAAGIFVALGYSFVLVRLTTSELTRPLIDMRRRMLLVSRGEYDHFVPVHNNDELGDLSEGFNRMVAGLAEREKVKSLFGQYLTREVSEQILNGRVNLEGDHFEATILFADIRNFTAMSEKMSPEEVLRFLNSYLEHMIDVIVANSGMIDKFIGDGILAIFGVPIKSGDHAERAVRAALLMQEALGRLNTARAQQSKPPISVGIGLHSGPVIAGNIGNAQKLEYTVLGDTVNLASRIEGLTKRYRSAILISDAVHDRLSKEFRQSIRLRPTRKASVRGKSDPITLFRVEHG